MLYFFDSHSRDKLGLSTADGCATLLQFTNLHKVAEHVKQLALSLHSHSDMFEVVPLTIHNQNEDTVQ